MKKLLFFFVLLSAVAQAQFTADGTPAWNSTAGTSPATTTVSMTVPTSGDTVVLSVMFLGTSAAFTITVKDDLNNTLTQSTNSPCRYTTNPTVWIFYILSETSGSRTFTATPSVAHGLSMHVASFKPTGTASFDKDACAVPTSGTTPVNTPSITPAAAGLLYGAAIADPNTQAGTFSTCAVGGSWTAGTCGAVASDNHDSFDEWQFGATGATTVNFTVTSSANSGWDAMAASFTSSGAGASTGFNKEKKLELVDQ